MSNRGVCKASAHSSGGSSHVEYMTREAVRGEVKEGRRDVGHGRHSEPDQTAGNKTQADDLIWTWNTPSFVTGNRYGASEEREAIDGGREGDIVGRRFEALGEGLRPAAEQVRAPSGQLDSERDPGRQVTDEHVTRMSFEEKQANALAYFGGQLDYEESLGGTSHYRIVVTVSRKVATAEGLKLAANDFLRDAFPRNPALACLHADTDNLHAHVLVPSRQLDGRRVDLKGDYFRLDEKWAKAAAEHFRDPAIYAEHFRAKQTTLAWKRQARKARMEGRPIPPKPDRHRDHWEVWNSDKPWSDFWCGRVAHALKTYEKKLECQTLTGAKPEELEKTRNDVRVLKEKYDRAAEVRRSAPDRKGRLLGQEGFSRPEGKRRMPPEIPTVSEKEKIREYQMLIREEREQRRKEMTEQMREPLREAGEHYLKGLTPESLLKMRENPKLLDLHTEWMTSQLLRTLKEEHTTLGQTDYTRESLTDYCRGVLTESSDRAHDLLPLDEERLQVVVAERRQNTEQLLPQLGRAAALHLKSIDAREYAAALRDEDKHARLVSDLVGTISGSIAERGLTLEKTEFTEESLLRWAAEQITRTGTELGRELNYDLPADRQQGQESPVPSYGTFETWEDHGITDFGGR